ncbi:MAG TPA: PEP-CTERM sorting domain-containing protein, partial [Rubrivivax sp.]|nr:PEP-CTERM sorting domain-containing protein [Rubrivivax sp.]
PTLLAIASAALLSSAQAAIFTTTGSLTTSDPTFNRPFEDLTGLSPNGTGVRYDVLNFVVGTTGEYTFLTTAMFDSFTILYSPTFSSSAPLMNARMASDDLLGLTTSGFAQNLTAGTNYFYVTAGFGSTDLGAYSTTIGGPGVITVVPEASTYAMMALGLGVLGIGRRRLAARAA